MNIPEQLSSLDAEGENKTLSSWDDTLEKLSRRVPTLERLSFRRNIDGDDWDEEVDDKDDVLDRLSPRECRYCSLKCSISCCTCMVVEFRFPFDSIV